MLKSKQCRTSNCCHELPWYTLILGSSDLSRHLPSSRKNDLFLYILGGGEIQYYILTLTQSKSLALNAGLPNMIWKDTSNIGAELSYILHTWSSSVCQASFNWFSFTREFAHPIGWFERHFIWNLNYCYGNIIRDSLLSCKFSLVLTYLIRKLGDTRIQA